MIEDYVKRSNLRRVVLAVAFLAAGAAHAGIPAMPEIPTTLPDAVRAALIAKREPLAARKLALIEEGKSLNQQCAKAEEGSVLYRHCARRQKEFNASVETLSAEMDVLEDQIFAAIDAHEKDQAAKTAEAHRLAAAEAEKKRLAALHNDPSIVDARGPRDGDTLIAQVPELARSPAADRITKGFQAVIDHDWPVALVWWQEALQRDPDNAALKRSVDLAQWMVDRRKIAAGPVTPAAPLTAAISAASRGETAEAIRQFEIVKAENPALAPSVDRMIAELEQKSARAVRMATEEYKFERMMRAYAQETFDKALFFLMTGNDAAADEEFAKAEYLSRSLPPDQRPEGLPWPSAKAKGK